MNLFLYIDKMDRETTSKEFNRIQICNNGFESNFLSHSHMQSTMVTDFRCTDDVNEETASLSERRVCVLLLEY